MATSSQLQVENSVRFQIITEDVMKNYKLYLSVSIITLLLTATLNAKDVYKWVDENGTIHFQGAPPQNTKQPVTVKRLPTYEDTYRDSQPSAPEQEKGNPGSQTTATARDASRKPEVELYVTSWCPHCKRAIDFLRSRRIAFTEYDIEKDKQAARRKNRLTRESGVPFAIINGQPVHGFSPVAYKRALEAYP
jgi:glutaredoxin